MYFSRLVHIVTLNWARWLPNLVQITRTLWKHLDRLWHLLDYGLNAWLCGHVRKQSSHSHSVRMYWSHSSPTAIHPKTQPDCWPSVVYVSCSLLQLLQMSLIFKLIVEHFSFAVVLTFINCWDVKWATAVQDIFTYAKLFALFLIIGFGAYLLYEGKNLYQSSVFPTYGLDDFNIGNGINFWSIWSRVNTQSTKSLHCFILWAS